MFVHAEPRVALSKANLEVTTMTKYFKKTKHFENLNFMRELERDIIKEEEGDIFTLTGLERGFDDEAKEEEVLAVIES
jgi:hypothetical protein